MWGSGTYPRCLDVYLHVIFKRFIIFKCVCVCVHMYVIGTYMKVRGHLM